MCNCLCLFYVLPIYAFLQRDAYALIGSSWFSAQRLHCVIKKLAGSRNMALPPGTLSETLNFADFSPRHVDHRKLSRSLSAHFLANVSCCRPPSVCRLSVTLVHPGYSGGCCNFSTPFGTMANGQPLTSTENFTEIVPGESLRRGS